MYQNLCDTLPIPTGSTMKNARHTLANILKNSGVHAGFIKGILGHESVTTTKFSLEGWMIRFIGK
jgi:integrase